MIAMGPNLITTTSGCRMAKWVYTTATPKKRFRDCRHLDAQPQTKVLPQNMTSIAALNDKLQPYDTIYVTFQKLPIFVANILPLVETDVVILTGQIYKTPPLDPDVVHALLEHGHVLHWFCQNLNLHYQYGRNINHDQKVSPFPYGLKQTVHKHHTRDDEALASFQQVFLETWNDTTNDRDVDSIYVGPLHPWPHRVAKGIPGAMEQSNATRLLPLEFYRQMARHRFVLSPNGDRPECYRHYEALGLGVIPITELDPLYYFHFQDGPIVYTTSNWDLEHLRHDLGHRLPAQGALQNMVLEEYWMEYIERTVGRPLRWGRQV
ncbi:MAG: hypothetical protein SGILL_004054 [Bacillariaceae sp.]